MYGYLFHEQFTDVTQYVHIEAKGNKEQEISHQSDRITVLPILSNQKQ